MTLTGIPAAAEMTEEMSLYNPTRSPDLRRPTLMTMSTSFAPDLIASIVSNALVEVVHAPSGKPTTAHGIEEDPERRDVTSGM